MDHQSVERSFKQPVPKEPPPQKGVPPKGVERSSKELVPKEPPGRLPPKGVEPRLLLPRSGVIHIVKVSAETHVNLNRPVLVKPVALVKLALGKLFEQVRFTLLSLGMGHWKQLSRQILFAFCGNLNLVFAGHSKSMWLKLTAGLSTRSNKQFSCEQVKVVCFRNTASAPQLPLDPRHLCKVQVWHQMGYMSSWNGTI
jgi:hypothetical protein